MMKSLKAKIISTIVTIAAAASVIVFGLSSFAWYTNNTEPTSEGLQIVTNSNGEIAVDGNLFTVYGYNIEDDQAELIFDDLALGSYNIFVPGRNTYNRRIVRVKLLFKNDVEIGSKISIKINCLADLLKEGGLYVDEKISNLIQFKFYDNYDGLIDQIDDTHSIGDVYDECVELFDNMNEYYSFVKINSGAASKPSKVIEINVDTPSLAEEETSFQTDFLIEYNYNDALVQYYKEHADSKFDLDFFKEGNAIPFKQDIECMEFSLKKE